MKNSSSALKLAMSAALMGAALFVHTAARADDALANKVAEAIVRDTGLVTVAVAADSRGVVSLEGMVNTDDEARAAEKAAKSTPGVTGVRDVLDVAAYQVAP